jgi:flavin-dependent dehydrogenase
MNPSGPIPSGPIVDNLVIGGGLAGSMVAIRLAAAGRSVTLLEKERTPHHKVCGEFLSREAIGYLHQVGVDPIALGASTIRSVRLSSKGREFESPLPFTALSLSRFTLDEALLARAQQSGCTVRRGVFVDGLSSDNGLWFARLRDSDPCDQQSFRAQNVFLSTGKHDLRGWSRAPAGQNDLVAFKLHWQLQPAQTQALRDIMELFLFPGGYGGLSLVEGDGSNLCLVVRRGRLRAVGGWPALLAAILLDNPLLRRRLQGAVPLWPRPMALSSIPYGHLSSHDTGGLWRLGDQAAVIPSFAGDGMSIALHSAALAAETYLAGGNPELFSRSLYRQLRPGMSLAVIIARVLLSPAGRTLAPGALSFFPSALSWIASRTRVPGEARLSGQPPPPDRYTSTS